MAITTMPRRASSREMLAWVSLDRWNPGMTTTAGAGCSAVAASGRKRSAATHCPFWVGRTIEVILTLPQELWMPEASPLKIKTTARLMTSDRKPPEGGLLDSIRK